MQRWCLFLWFHGLKAGQEVYNLNVSINNLDFQAIYEEYRPRILRYLAHLVGDYEAEDLTQEVFLKINKSLQGYRGEAKLGTWIYRITANAAIDRLRQRASGTVEIPLETAANTGEEDIEAPVAGMTEPDATIEEEVFRREGFDCFCDVINDLPETYRLVLALDQLSEYTAREIADLLGLSIEVVKIRLHRGRAMLLQALKTHCKPEDWL